MLSRRVLSSSINVGRRNCDTKLVSCNLQNVRSLHNNTPVVNSSTAAYPSAKTSQYDEESLWVRSNKADIPTVVGYTVPEIIRENLGGWGNLPAFVCHF